MFQTDPQAGGTQSPGRRSGAAGSLFAPHPPESSGKHRQWVLRLHEVWEPLSPWLLALASSLPAAPLGNLILAPGSQAGAR